MIDADQIEVSQIPPKPHAPNGSGRKWQPLVDAARAMPRLWASYGGVTENQATHAKQWLRNSCVGITARTVKTGPGSADWTVSALYTPPLETRQEDSMSDVTWS